MLRPAGRRPARRKRRRGAGFSTGAVGLSVVAALVRRVLALLAAVARNGGILSGAFALPVVVLARHRRGQDAAGGAGDDFGDGAGRGLSAGPGDGFAGILVARQHSGDRDQSVGDELAGHRRGYERGEHVAGAAHLLRHFRAADLLRHLRRLALGRLLLGHGCTWWMWEDEGETAD